MEQLTINISGMSCGHCVGAVTQALNNVDGVQVEEVRVGTARVAFDAGRTSADRIAQAVEDAGYGVRPVQIGHAPQPGSRP